MKARLATVMCAILGATITALTPLAVPVGVAAPSDCAPVAIVPIRASNEGRESTKNNVPSEGWEGPTLHKLLNRLYTDNADLRNVPIVEVKGPDYPAVVVDKGAEVRAVTLLDSPVYNSSEQGVTTAIRAIGQFRHHDSRGCAFTKFVLVGYSQGAMVARQVAANLPSLIGSGFLYGDPWHKPGAAGNTGEGSNGTGAFRANYPGVAGNVDKYYGLPGIERHSLCHGNDFVCGVGVGPVWESIFNDGAQHSNYFSASAEEKAESNLLAASLRRLAGSGTPTEPSTPPGDVAIVVNTPAAVLGVQPLVIASSEAVISGLESTGSSGLTYTFDLDGDGTFEVTTADGYVVHTFSKAGPVSLQLKVTDSCGRTSFTSATIDVIAPETAVQQEGQEESGTGSSGSTGSWSGSSGS